MKKAMVIVLAIMLLIQVGDRALGADDQELRELRAQNRMLQENVTALRKEVDRLRAEIAALKAGGVVATTRADKAPVVGTPSSNSNTEDPTTTPAVRAAIGVSVFDITGEQLLEKVPAAGAPRPPRKGALVRRVSPGSPADRAGLKSFDLIVRIDVAQVTDGKTFSSACKNVLTVGKKCTIQVLRIVRLPGGKGQRWVSKGLVVTPAPWAEVKAAGEACPIKLIGALIAANTIGQPEAWLSVQNISTQDVVAFEVAIDCFDRFDRPVAGFLTKSNRVEGLSQKTIAPGKKGTGGWTLHGHDTTAKVVVTLLRVKLADGQEWTPKEGDIVSVSGESPK